MEQGLSEAQLIINVASLLLVAAHIAPVIGDGVEMTSSRFLSDNFEQGERIG